MTETLLDLATELRRELNIANDEEQFVRYRKYFNNFVDRIENVNGGSQPATSERLTNGGESGVSDGDLLTWIHDSGSSLLNLDAPTLPTVVTDGLYSVTVHVALQSALSAATEVGLVVEVGDAVSPANARPYPAQASLGSTVSWTGPLHAGDTLFSQMTFNGGGTGNCGMTVWLSRLGDLT